MVNSKQKKYHIRMFTIVSCSILILSLATSYVFAEEYKWPKSLSFSTHAVGTSSHATASAWTPVMDKMTGMKIRIVPQSNSTIAARNLKKGARDLLVATDISFAEAIESSGEWGTREGGAFPMRIVWLGQKAFFGVMVRGDSYIKSIYDIKPGTKVSNFSVVPGFRNTLTGILAWAKVSPDDVEWKNYGSFSETIRAVADGKADITYGPTSAPVVFESASKPHGLRFIPVDMKKDPEGAKRWLSVVPTTSFGTMMAGVKSAIDVPGRVTSYILGTNASSDADLIYNIAKWLGENYDSYKDKHKDCVLMNLESFRETLDTTFLPVHEGTIRYLKEKGMWSEADEKRQAYNVTLVNRYIKRYDEAIAEADKQKIEVNPENEAWKNLWAEYRKDIPRFKVMLTIP